LPRNGLESSFIEGDGSGAGRAPEVNSEGGGAAEDFFVENGAVDLVAGKTNIVAGARFAGVVEGAGVFVIKPEAHALFDEVLLVEVFG